MTHGSLFSGIGGFDCAAEWMGWENLFHCEINTFCQRILKYYWPDAKLYEDIKTTDFTIWRGRIDVLSGGFPCQPYSTAGKRKGKEDDRHLWPEMLRAVREISPRYVVGENVRGLTNWNGGLVFDEVQADLEAEGYEVLPFLLPACAINAPHRRDRIWFIAHAKSSGQLRKIELENNKEDCGEWGRFNTNSVCEVPQQDEYGAASNSEPKGLERENGVGVEGTVQPPEYITPDTGLLGQEINEKQAAGVEQCDKINDASDTDSSQRPEGWLHKTERKEAERYAGTFDSWDGGGAWQNFPTQSPVCSRNDVVPGGLDGITFSKWRNESIKGFGNAVVPALVLQLFKAIQLYENGFK
jgi:DNA (cytosine-5)-methyltransferase 1